MLDKQEFSQLLKWIPLLSREQETKLMTRLKLASRLGVEDMGAATTNDWLLTAIGDILKSKGVCLKKPTLYDARRWCKSYDVVSETVRAALENRVTGPPLSAQEKLKLGRLVVEAVVVRCNDVNVKHIVRLVPYFLDYFDRAYPGYLLSGTVRLLITATVQNVGE